MLAQAIQEEVEEWITARAELRDAQGRRQVVRNGYLPQRTISSGIGPIEVRQPRVRDHRPPGEAEPFTSKILPPYLRKTKSIEELIPWLYLTLAKHQNPDDCHINAQGYERLGQQVARSILLALDKKTDLTPQGDP